LEKTNLESAALAYGDGWLLFWRGDQRANGVRGGIQQPNRISGGSGFHDPLLVQGQQKSGVFVGIVAVWCATETVLCGMMGVERRWKGLEGMRVSQHKLDAYRNDQEGMQCVTTRQPNRILGVVWKESENEITEHMFSNPRIAVFPGSVNGAAQETVGILWAGTRRRIKKW
jgi:hypothetical protein